MKRIIVLILASLVASSLVTAKTTDEIIAMAREFKGGEAALEAVESISFRGVLHNATDPEAGTRELYLCAMKPRKYFMEMTYGETVDVRASDGLEGWTKRTGLNEAGEQALIGFGITQSNETRLMAASGIENVYFYQIPDYVQRVAVENKGETEKYGESVYWLRYNHGFGIFFDRYFHTDTGRLVATGTSTGMEIVDYGTLEVGGVKFAERQVMYFNGEKLNELVFEEVQVNPELDDDLFAIPSLRRGRLLP